jgi:hypothetical protein
VLGSGTEAFDPFHMYNNRQQVKRDGDWQKIERLRTEIWGLRSKAHTPRQELREKQYAKSAADDRYINYVRMDGLGLSTSITRERLEELFRYCEQARDECGPLEDDYFLLEELLGKQEFELEKLEEKFYQCPVAASPSLSTHCQHTLAPLPPVSGQGKYETTDQRYYPLVMAYLSKVGDIEILQERLRRDDETKTELEYRKDLMKIVNLELLASDEAWLDNYQRRRDTLLEELKDAEREAEKLKQACLDNGLPLDFDDWENNVNVRQGTSNYVKFPLLVPNNYEEPIDFGKRKFNFQGFHPDPGEVLSSWRGGTEDRVNQWLLHQLRSSPLDSHLLTGILIQESGSGHDGKVELTPKVLELWFNSCRKKRWRRNSGLRIPSVPSCLAGLFWIFGQFLLPVTAIPTEPPSIQAAANNPPSNESLLINGGVVIGLSLAYTAIVSYNRLSTVTIIVPIGIFLLGMDNCISNWQLTFCCVFSGSLITANLKDKFESLPKSGGLTALCITILGVLSACLVAYFVGFEKRYEFEGRYANPWIFGAVIAFSTTMLVSEFWINAFYRTGLAKRIEAGEYNESILRVVKDVSAELFLTLVTQIPGFRAFGINWERARDQRLGPAPPNHPRQMFSEAAAIEEGFVVRQS